jgi:hypothetical protein
VFGSQEINTCVFDDHEIAFIFEVEIMIFTQQQKKRKK